MVKAREPYHAFARPGAGKQCSTRLAVVRCPRQRPPQLETRAFCAPKSTQPQRFCGHPGDPVSPPLVALADVVYERCHQQLRVGFAPLHEPPRGRCSMHDVARMLAPEQRQQSGWK